MLQRKNVSKLGNVHLSYSGPGDRHPDLSQEDVIPTV